MGGGGGEPEGRPPGAHIESLVKVYADRFFGSPHCDRGRHLFTESRLLISGVPIDKFPTHDYIDLLHRGILKGVW